MTMNTIVNMKYYPKPPKDRKGYSIPLVIMGKGPDGRPIRDLKGNIIMVYAPYYRGAGAGKGKRPSRSK